MPGLLTPVSQLASILTSLGLVGSLLKPIPPLIDSVQSQLGPTVNPLLGGLGLSLLVTPDASTNATTAAPQAPNTTQAEQQAQTSQRCVVEAYEVPPPTSFTYPPFDKADATIYRYRQQQAVNLGAWFVLEQWMTPSLFECAAGNKTSELDFAKGWGAPELARMVIEKHWDTYITEADFAYLASIGINTVRLPIGHWSLGPAFLQGTGFEEAATVYTNAWARVVRAINTAAKYQIGVIVDLHGAPGSQNGLPSSGISDGIASMLSDKAHIDRTTAVLTFLTQQFASVSNVVGLQLVNEPLTDPQLEQFYDSTISTLRSLSPEALSLPFYVHDSFDLPRFSKFVGNRQDFVVLDHHSFFIFSPTDAAIPATNQTTRLQGGIATALYNASITAKRNMIIGEFSCALSDEALAKESDPEAARKEFCTAQYAAYQNITAGSAFWSYNEEGCQDDNAWCFRNMVGKYLPSTFSAYEGGNSGTGRTPSQPGAMPKLSDTLAAAIKQLKPPSAIANELQNAGNGTQANLDGSSDTPVTPDTLKSTINSNTGLGLRKRGSAWARHRDNHSAGVKRYVEQEGMHAIQRRSASAAEQAISLGYSEGFETGRAFAARNLSKLGFIYQYIEDTLAAHIVSNEIDPAQANYYRTWFNKGLADSEALVSQAISAESS